MPMMDWQINQNIMNNHLIVNENIKSQKVDVPKQDDMLFETYYIDLNQNIQISRIPKNFNENSQQLKQLQGMMLKKSPYSLIGFQKKYCIIESRILSYYNFEEKDRLEGQLNFDLQDYQYFDIKNAYNQVIEFKQMHCFFFRLIPNGCDKQFIF
ncbi:unnamed protein product [Paramecium sonneborni]|uniref:Uncharacterized protein n=1 Tax=Paramecium sonneborni TaxID=65129 RepID=A0A8S1P832_9CILI|nr:unnamed protein product [Paramecium sonneborni]